MSEVTSVDKYDVLEQIGRGSFGIIRKVRRKSDGAILCRKEINYHSMQDKEKEQLYSEFSILHSLKHPNIVGYYHREHLRSSHDLHLYMEYCSGGDLGKVIKDLKAKKEHATEDYIWNIFSQIVTALYRCHYGVDPPVPDEFGRIKLPGLRLKNQVMILHRDLKPENIFLGEGDSVKLGDFGLSKVMQSHDFASTYVGTPYYMSPEICASERYTLHSDVWALGCIMYELCSTRVPFNAATHIQLIQKINSGKTDHLPAQYSQELNDVVRSCLKVNPHHRPDTATLINHGKVGLAREKREVVELGKRLQTDERQLALKVRNFHAEKAQWEAGKEQWKAQKAAELEVRIEDSKRREWEVKATLEIEKRVQSKTAELQAQFESEVQRRVEAQMNIGKQEVHPTRPLSPPSTQSSAFAQNISDDLPSVNDLSNLSLDSPAEEQPKPLQFKRITPPKRRSRGPLARSRTQFDSPADITMGEPSPMPIQNLNLSPRRTAATNLPSIHNTKNIFAAAAQKPVCQLPTPPSLDHSIILEDDDEDGLPELPSPTRAPTAAAKPIRPGFLRQKTAPLGRLPSQPALFPASRASPPRLLSTVPAGSPTRNKPKDMFRQVMARNVQGIENVAPGSDENAVMKKAMQRNLGGKTLVELAQPRTVPANSRGAAAKGMSGEENNWRPKQDVVVWDPEVDEMPSPFLSRVRRQRSS